MMRIYTMRRPSFYLLLICAVIFVLGVTFVTRERSSQSASVKDFKLHSNPAQRCQPSHHIYYNKEHKTGSSTLVNILYRYGDNRNLTFVMPKAFVWFDWPQHFHLFNIRPLYGQQANILCCHTRYNKGPVNFLFPRKRAKYITLIRSPVSNFDSVFNWFKLGKDVGLSREIDPLRAYLRAPPEFKRIPFGVKHRVVHLLRNPALFGLGLDYKYFQNRSKVMSYIKYIDKEFDLVMISDYYDESLILLKELLCWDFEDIWYIKQKVRQNKAPLSEEVKTNILSWNKADALLFDYFNKSFWRKVSDMGPKFYEDLRIFREQNRIIGEICLNKQWKGESSILGKDPDDYIQLCKQMTTLEGAYIEYMKAKMDKRATDVDKYPPYEYFGASENSWYSGHDLLYRPVRLD